jgi:CRISPR system Cascade subunit CasD
MPAFLILRFEAPLMSFGREAIDANGPTRDFPDASMLTGLLANALGYSRHEAAKHQRLQDRLAYGVRIDRLGHDLREYQTARLSKTDRSWTTRGRPEGRAGGEKTYDSPHIRFRHYRADAALTVAVRLDPAEEPPTLGDLATALDYPARPLFVGRKPCLPSAPLFAEIRDAKSIVVALQQPGPADGTSDRCRFVLPRHEADGLGPSEIIRVTGRRDWTAGVHTGEETLAVLTLPTQAAGGADA